MNIVQSASSSSSAGDPATATAALTGVTAGNAIVAIVKQHDTASRNYSVSDSVAGSYGAKILEQIGASSQEIEAFVYYNHPGGSVTVTATVNIGAINFYLSIFELNGIGQLLAHDEGNDTSTGDANAYACPTGLTNATESIAVAVVCSAVDATGYTAPTGYAKATGDSNGYGGAAAKYFASGVSSERPAFTQTGTPRANTGMLLLFAASGGGVGGSRRVSTCLVS